VAVAAATVDKGLRLPDEITADPAVLPPSSQPPRLPQTLSESIEQFAGDAVLKAAMDEHLLEAFLAVRRAEVDLFAGQPDEDIVAATRWRY
jgi:glutamine synthetase